MQKNVEYCTMPLFIFTCCRTKMAVPIVDRIDWNNFRVSDTYSKSYYRGIFEWGFLYKEALVPKREHLKHKYPSEPYRLILS